MSSTSDPQQGPSPKGKIKVTRQLHLLGDLTDVLNLGRKEFAELMGAKEGTFKGYLSEEASGAVEAHAVINFRLLFLFGVRPIYPWARAPLTTIQGADYDPAWYFAWSSIDSLPRDDWMETNALEWELGYRVLVASSRYRWFEKHFIFPFENADDTDWQLILKSLQLNPKQSLVAQRDRVVKQMIQAVPSTSVEKLDIFSVIKRADILSMVTAIGVPSPELEVAIANRADFAKETHAFGLKKRD